MINNADVAPPRRLNKGLPVRYLGRCAPVRAYDERLRTAEPRRSGMWAGRGTH